MLGRLAKWLRALGYDTVYLNERNKSNVIMQSLKENRILVTRDHRMSRKRAWDMVLVRSDRVAQQVRQVIDETRIPVSRGRLFTRCTVCNGVLRPVADKGNVITLVPEYVFRTQNEFSRCASCGRVYWPGTHRDLLLKDLERAGIRL